MSQVPAITNETFKAPEPSNIQRSNDNFLDLLEKEKLKTQLPALFPFNIQSFFNTPLLFNPEKDKTVSRIVNYSAIMDHFSQNSMETSAVHDGLNVEEHKQEQTVKAAETPKEAKAVQAKFTANAINKIFAGELELSPDLYSALITAKNNSSSLRAIDVDDLISQIKDKIKFLSENGKIELSIELKPENLGTVLMNISSNKGLLTINIYADQAAKQALEENIAELERSLKLANLNIENLNILSGDRRQHNKSGTA